MDDISALKLNYKQKSILLNPAHYHATRSVSGLGEKALEKLRKLGLVKHVSESWHVELTDAGNHVADELRKELGKE